MMSSAKNLVVGINPRRCPGSGVLAYKRAKPIKTLSLALGTLLIGFTAFPNSILACAACYGQDDSPMAQGMNWGIISLLAVVVTVLGGFAAFFVYLARKAAAASATAAADALLANANKVQS